ncbi:Hypothetical protein LUCI_2924 [Lucifera butyrica]|uniref:Cell envelope-related transcriptional attenuator domain-containing protein n=1 Tax=Lucifera butyrica TaxID=1351585 RepID=A0A498R901_9FIRM|nr:LCP family protein [Lucifera butyrica]VBB07659.1 Hypothetical protein LUCI_2924 [Lucifera butyrica]
MSRKYRGPLLLVMLFIMLFAASTGVTLYLQNYFFPIEPAVAPALSISGVPPAAISENRINILLMGLDDGDPGKPANPRRSDTMIVASIDPQTKTINLLSIPRDTRVHIPGYKGYEKINNAYFFGGPELAMRTVSQFLQTPVRYYVVMDWQAFIKVVDILGGVDLTVNHPMNYEDPYENLNIHLAKGYQHLDGEKAGEYVRFRHDALGDIGRVKRQQEFLQALLDQLLQTRTIFKLPSLVQTINKYVHTDMSLFTWLKLAGIAKDMSADSLHTETVPGQFATIHDLSYWLPDLEKTRTLAESILK